MQHRQTRETDTAAGIIIVFLPEAVYIDCIPESDRGKLSPLPFFSYKKPTLCVSPSAREMYRTVTLGDRRCAMKKTYIVFCVTLSLLFSTGCDLILADLLKLESSEDSDKDRDDDNSFINTPPSVERVLPENGETNVPTETAFTVVFRDEKAIEKNSLVINTVDSVCGGYSVQLSADDFITCVKLKEEQFSETGLDVTFKPAIRLSSLETYKIRVTTAVRDIDGAYLESEYTSGGFTTRKGGILDTAFNGRGFITYRAINPTNNASGKSVAIDNKNRIVVTGIHTTAMSQDMGLWRYTPDGQPDTTFGPALSGAVTHDGAAGVANKADEGSSLVIDPSGRIVIAGKSDNGANNDLIIWQYTESGYLDPSFNAVGFYSLDGIDTSGFDDEGNAIALNGDRIIVAGAGHLVVANANLGVAAYSRSTGTLDASFSIGGKVTFHDGQNDYAYALAVDTQNRVVAAGMAGDLPYTKMVVVRYLPNGVLDNSFNGMGSVMYDDTAGGNGMDAAKGIAIDSAGKIVVCGFSTNGANNFDMVLWRLMPDGILDTSFGGGFGYIVHRGAAGGNDDDFGNAVAIDDRGRIVVAGTSKNSANNFDMVLWRFLPDGSMDWKFGENGIVIHSQAAGSAAGDDTANSVALDRDGRIIVTGLSVNASGQQEMAIWCYTP
jgi:uncharacterized delta-60 repeat protein